MIKQYQHGIIRVVSKKEKLIKKLQKGTIKAKDLKALLLLSGANLDRIKGSHEQWIFNDKRLTLATHRKELDFYQIKQAKEFLDV